MSTPHRVVFDCVVFAQALLSTTGPAAECIKRAREKRFELFVSSQILQEIRELPLKMSVKHQITSEKANQLADEIKLLGIMIDDVPPIYTHPTDPDDSTYINLAL